MIAEPAEGLSLLAYRIAIAAHLAGNLGALAREWNVSPAYLSAVRLGRKTAPEWMLKRLGLRRTILADEGHA